VAAGDGRKERESSARCCSSEGRKARGTASRVELLTRWAEVLDR